MSDVFAEKPELAIMKKNATYLAMDVGGTNICAGLVNGDGRVLAGRRFPTCSGRPPAEVIADMVGQLSSLCDEMPPERRPSALVVGLPGWIDQAEGVLIQAPNMPGWKSVPLASILSRALNISVLLENDTNLYAMGEWLYGAGQGLTNLIVITLGTGVGGGLILNGRLWNGSFATAVEIGHIPLALRGGALCGCGRRGCLETVASATGMSRLGREWLEKGRPTLYQGRPGDLDTKIMFELAERGDPMSLAVFRRAGEALGQVLCSIFNLMGLESVVVGGGVAGAFDHIYPSIAKMLAKRLVVADPKHIKILKSRLGDYAPLIGGGALLAKQQAMSQ